METNLRHFKLLSIFIILLLVSLIKSASEIEGRIRKDGTGKWIIETANFSEEYSYIATAFYNPSLSETGWDTLSLTTNKIFNDELQAEAAGRLEASLTKERIYSHYTNMLSTAGSLSDEAAKFFREQEYYLLSKRNEYQTNPILYNAYLLYLQYKGLREQYNIEMPEEKYIREIEFNVMNSFGDVFDINAKIEPPQFHKMSVEEIKRYFFLNNHCTAIFKLKYDLSDIFYGHNSWYYYNMMTRIFKEYNLNFNHPSVKSHNIMFSSYPGSIVSNDDYYYTSQGLVVIETTNENYNTSSYKYITEDSLLCWERVQIANRISETSREWADNFIKYNSGTYNNQYMVLDTKRIDFTYNETNNTMIFPNALVIVEQMPGFVDINDVTDHLKFGYWPSYNVPYSKKVYEYANITETIKSKEETREIMDYDICTRANILRRDQDNITDIDSMKYFMKYNDYLNDPFSLGEPTNSIAARGDLRSKPLCFGAFDTKIGSVRELKENKEKKMYLYAGPTDQVKPLMNFNSEGCKNVKHEGIPDVPQFDWTTFVNKFNFEE